MKLGVERAPEAVAAAAWRPFPTILGERAESLGLRRKNRRPADPIIQKRSLQIVLRGSCAGEIAVEWVLERVPG